MIRKFIFLTTLFLLVFGGGNAWAEDAVFSFSNGSSPTTVSGISISGGSKNNEYYAVASGATLTIAAESGKTITAISFTFTDNKSDRYGGTVTANDETGTYTPNGASASWTGSASSVSLTTTNKMRISGLTVTYTTDEASHSADLGAPDYTHGYKWDFTNISMTNIAADVTNWELNGTKYRNKGALTNANLIANSAYIPETKYLTFSATANNLWLSNTSDNKYLAISQHGSVKIPNVTAGKTVIIGWFNGNGSSVTASVTNATNVDGGAESISTSATQGEVTEAYLTATGGDITLTPNGWAYFKYIIIADKKTITVSDMKFSPKVNSQGLCASDGLDRTLGGFGFAFTGGQGIKYNNSTNLLIRYYDSSNTGVITITPQKSSTGTITIPRVDIAVNSSSTGSVSANGGSAESISSVSSHSFSNLSGETFTLTGVSGDVFIESFTIYYTDFAGVLNETMITPAITWSKSSDALTTADGYTSPTITTSPANLDISIASNNTDVATVAKDDWTTAGIVSLTGTGGNATITASSTASTFFNAATAATYTISLNNSYEKWNFTSLDVANTITGDTGWNGASGWEAYPSSGTVKYYQNKFTASGRGTESTYAPTSPSQLEGLKFARDNSSGLAAGQIRLYNDHMYFNNNNIMIKVPVTAGDNVLVTFDGGNGSSPAGFSFSNATLEGDDTATQILSDDTQRTATLIATETGYVTLTVTYSKVNLYRIQVVTDERAALTQFRPLGSQTYEYTKSGAVTTTSNYTIVFQPNNALQKNVDESTIHVESSDPSVLDVSNVEVSINNAVDPGRIILSNIRLGEGGTAYLTVTFDGNASYKPATTTTPVFTIHAPSSFLVQVEDQQIQQGQRSQLTPVITDKDGNLIGIHDEGAGVYSTYVLDEDEDVPDYTNYFDFSYAAGSGTGENYTYIEVDDETGAVTTRSGDNMAAVGATREISITATPKSAYASLFSSASANTTATMTIIEAAAAIELNFYWNSGCTSTYQVKAPANASDTSQDYKLGDDETGTSASIGVFGKSGTFASGFPNGRMLYVTTNENSEGDEIWFSYAKNKEAATLTPDRNIDKNKHIYQYRRGIPIYIDEKLAAGDYIFVNVVAVHKNPETGLWGLNGGVARMKFFMTNHSRPAAPTYDPVSPDAEPSKNNTTDATFENANGGKIMDTSENVVAYGEGASKTTEGYGNLVYGKFSTSSIYTTEQLINEAHVVQGINSVPVVSTEVAKRRFTTVQIKTEAEGADYISYQTHTEYWYLYDTRLTVTPAGNQYINVSTSTSEPTTTVQWYNKATPGWQDVNTKTVTFSIASYSNADDAEVNETTGAVTAGSKTGWVRVKASYEGGEWHGKTDGEPQYRSQTAPSETYFYVYISDPSKEEPRITPPTRKFTTIQNYTIQAPATWDVWYTVDGSDPATSGTRYALTHGTSINGVATKTVRVRAIAYNPNAPENVSREVSETYTKVDPLPDPIFDPDGVPQPYHYYTSSLTVQIACAYAGSVIYYTVDGSDPEMGAANTYKYSGLEKVVISGNVSIKAVAYDPENDLFSNVVTSNYMYSSDMEMPYFQISDDGSTWTGKYKNGETVNVTPKTQIRIVDPNSMKGTIYYTLDGDMPGDNASSLTYVDGYPFTVAKTTTGNAIVILEEASSSVATATFLIDSSVFPVWEAVEQTTPGGVLAKDDGFVISTNSSLSVTNSGSKVNTNSLASGGTGYITYAQADITATFGGFDLIDWSVLTLPDDAIGTPIDGVGKYTIKNATNDAKDEKGVMYNHRNSLDANCPQTHDKTFKLPSQGAYVKFEPERDGDLTIWGLQQGAIQYSEDVALCDKFIRRRAVYFVDEQGKSYPVKEVNGVPQLWSSARLSANWTRVAANYDNWTPLHTTDDNVGYQEALINGHMTKVYNNFYTNEESNAIYNMYNSYLTTNGISVGDPIKPFPIHTGNILTWKGGQDADASDDGTGYVMPSGGFVKYTFEVKAGKTYFFFGHLTKIGIRGFQFIPTETDGDVDARPSITIHANETSDVSTVLTPAGEMSLESAVDDYGDEPVNVTLNRTFKANTWTTLLLPFSVSVAQIEKVFGAQTDIILFDDVINDDREIHMIRHWHKMIVAGTPVIIMPRQNVADPVFQGVHLEAKEVDEISSTNGHYKMTGTFVKAENALNKYDYYINTSGNFTWLSIDHASVKGSFSWLKVTPSNPNPSRMLSVAFSDFSDNEDEGMATGIINVEMPDNISGNTTSTNEAVYNLKGQKMVNGSLKQLSKGVYIVNGKKVVVE